jgi:hypothetical protein
VKETFRVRLAEWRESETHLKEQVKIGEEKLAAVTAARDEREDKCDHLASEYNKDVIKWLGERRVLEKELADARRKAGNSSGSSQDNQSGSDTSDVSNQGDAGRPDGSNQSGAGRPDGSNQSGAGRPDGSNQSGAGRPDG